MQQTGWHPRLAVMNFLSEVAFDYPSAISFVSGRPADGFFELEHWRGAVEEFYRRTAAELGRDESWAAQRFTQYGRTNGSIGDLIALQARHDHGLAASGEQIVITNGCQEALFLCVQEFCGQEGDVILARNPTYIGLTGAADLAGVPVRPLQPAESETWGEALHRTVAGLERDNQRARLLYLIPEFDNPTGTALSIEDRRSILEACAKHGIIVLEDNPYGMFRFEGASNTCMAALDRHGLVLYLGTYSKTLCPSVRIGFIVIPQALLGSSAATRALSEKFSIRKSFLTLNTSQWNQALVGGILLREEGTLARVIQPALAHYRRNRGALIDSLSKQFAPYADEVRWNNPQGGFFLTLELPFGFGRDEMLECARAYDVLVMPMSFFALDDKQSRCVRLAFSNVTPEEIETGVKRLAAFLEHRLSKRVSCPV